MKTKKSLIFKTNDFLVFVEESGVGISFACRAIDKIVNISYINFYGNRFSNEGVSMISINDVAKKAGVSKSTVSKVFNNYDLISDKTKKKVEKAAKELGYTPNPLAVSLSKKNFNKIGLIVDIRHNSQFVDEISMQYITSAFKKSREHKIEVVTFFSSQFDDMSHEEIKKILKSQRINALIIYHLSIENQNLYKIIEEKEFFIVLVDSYITSEKTSCISVNNRKAQYEVAKLTLEESENKNSVLYIAGGMDGYITDERIAAIIKLQEEYGFELMIRNGDFNEAKARQIAYEHGEDADVIICASDLMAIGAAYAIKELGLERPISGFDGIKLMGYTQLNLNTVKQNSYLISERAFDELVSLINGSSGEHIIIEHEVSKIRYLDIIQ